MKLLSINGKPIKKPVFRFRIKWDGKSRSKFQFNVKQLLKVVWEHDIVFEEFPVFGTKLKLDFFNATKMIALEVQGEQHISFNSFFHQGSRSNYLDSIKRDYSKVVWLELNKIKLVEIFQKDLKNLADFYKMVDI